MPVVLSALLHRNHLSSIHNDRKNLAHSIYKYFTDGDH